eukprot:8054581-Pyramimonas_sp.AAC.1
MGNEQRYTPISSRFEVTAHAISSEVWERLKSNGGRPSPSSRRSIGLPCGPDENSKEVGSMCWVRYFASVVRARARVTNFSRHTSCAKSTFGVSVLQTEQSPGGVNDASPRIRVAPRALNCS